MDRCKCSKVLNVSDFNSSKDCIHIFVERFYTPLFWSRKDIRNGHQCLLSYRFKGDKVSNIDVNWDKYHFSNLNDLIGSDVESEELRCKNCKNILLTELEMDDIRRFLEFSSDGKGDIGKYLKYIF